MALSLIATFPMVGSPTSRLIGHLDVDATNHAWGPWWWWNSIGRGEIPWHTTLLGAPAGGVLWFIDPFTAAVGAPVVGLVGGVGAYNLAILVSVALAAAGGRSLARAFGAGPEAAWITAAACAFSPYLLSEVHNGVSEAVGVAWGTFALAAARRAIEEPGRRRWAITGVWLGIAAAGTWYYGFSAGITIGAWALLTRRRREAVPGALFAGAIGLVIAAPVLALVRASIRDPGSLVVRGDVPASVRELLLTHNAVDPRAFFAPGGFQSVDLAGQGEAFLHSSYVGLVALGLAVVGMRGRSADPTSSAEGESPALALLGVVPAALFSLGAYLWWGSDWVHVGTTRLALPFGWLVRVLPDAGSTHAQRLVWPLLATVAALAAVGAQRVAKGRAQLFGVGALIAVDLLLSAPWPIARLPELDLRSHAKLRQLALTERAAGTAGAHGVLDLPAEVGATMATSVYLLYQTASGLPIPYRPDARGGTSSMSSWSAFNVLFWPSAARPDQAAVLERELARVAQVDIASIETTGGIRWIVLHRELERGRGDVAVLEAQLRAWYGTPGELGTHLTWDVRHRRANEGDVLVRPVAPGG